MGPFAGKFLGWSQRSPERALAIPCPGDFNPGRQRPFGSQVRDVCWRSQHPYVNSRHPLVSNVVPHPGPCLVPAPQHPRVHLKASGLGLSLGPLPGLGEAQARTGGSAGGEMPLKASLRILF